MGVREGLAGCGRARSTAEAVQLIFLSLSIGWGTPPACTTRWRRRRTAAPPPHLHLQQGRLDWGPPLCQPVEQEQEQEQAKQRTETTASRLFRNFSFHKKT